MKRKNNLFKRLMIFALIVMVVTAMIVSLCTFASAANTIEIVGEMEKDFDGGEGIAKAFESYKIQETVRTKNSDVDGDIQYTVYFDRGEDSSKTVIPGYNGTRILLYAVNTGAERIGTDTNRKIISSMLERGYFVVVVDYLNDPKACGLQLATSAAKLQVSIRDGKLFDKSTDVGAAVFAKSGSYYETFVVPSGYNVSLENVFWEIDKHSMEGTLDKIVENWNSDFRTAKANKIVKWVKADGTRKTTRTVDGESAVWYSDAAGTVEDAEGGQYVKVKFTVAESITDCVNPDGTPLDMNLYSNVIYPTSPENEVPVYVRASAHGDVAACTISDTPRYTMFLFGGYAVASYDYLWQPMALNTSFGYYDGSQGETNDHMNYGLMMYNDKLVNTAAMRFLRHLSANGGETYNFALDKIGVIGASKGGWFTFIGEKIVQSPLATGTYATTDEREEAINAALCALMSDRYYSTESGKTRYQTDSSLISGDVYTGDYAIDAGARQPWLTYPDGSEIISGCQAVYAGVGSQVDDVTEGHVPIFEIANLYDDYSAAYNSANSFINLSKNLDIEAYYFDTPLGHSIAQGPDLNYGVDTFDAMVAFFDYYLKDSAVKVLYTEPRADERKVALTDKITIKFMGSVSETEIGKVVISFESGAVTGSWSAAVGKTEWTFTPDSLSGNTVYTVTVPADLVGSNGTAMGEEYSYSFVTEYDNATALTYNSGYYTFTAPALTSGNSFAFRFFVENDAVNTAELYAVGAVGDTEGTLLGKINVNGVGSYEIDVTDYVLENVGEEVTLLLKEGRGVVSESVINDTLDGTISSNISAGSKVTLTSGAEAGDRTALMAVVSSYTTNGVSKYYLAESKAFTYSNVTGGYVVTEDDVGRTYTFSIDIYDTISRTVTLRMKNMTKKANGTLDYDRKYLNVNTKAGEWTTVEFIYTVYETKYGEISNNIIQSLDVHIATDGNAASPIYFSNFKVDEVLTSLDVKSAYIAEKDNGLGEYTAPVSDKAFAVYNGDTLAFEYGTLAEALAAYVSGYTLKLQSDYHFTDDDATAAISDFEKVDIDLGSYTVYCDNTSYSLFHIKADNYVASEINVSGGNILLGRTALISYEGSTSAGNGKNVNLNFQNSYIGFNDNAYTTEVISDGTGVSDVEIVSNIRLTDCVIDLPEERHAKSNTVIFPTSESSDLTINYTVSGGEIRLTKTRWISILENKLEIEFAPNASGEFTKLVMPSYITWEMDGTFVTTAGFANFAAGEAEDGYVTHTFTVPENSTRYGIIPEAYLDAEAYPFVVFDGNGNFISAHAVFMGANNNNNTDAVSRVKNLQAANTTFTNGVMNNKTAAVILMRRDYTYISGERYDNWAQIAGEITIDLGGYSMTQNTTDSTRRALFRITSKAWTNSSKFPYYWDTTINIINGTLYTYDKTFFGLSGSQSSYENAGQYISEKDFTFNFDGVTFALMENSPLTDMMVTCNTPSNLANFVEPAPFNFNFNNCDFDITGSAADTLTVLDADSEEEKWLKLTFKVSGGNIVTDDISGIKLYSSNGTYGSSIEFAKSSNGEYITLIAETDLGSIDTPFPTDEGAMYLTNSGTADGKVVYKLEKSTVKTVYGALPASEEGTESEKPLAVFAPSSSSDTGYIYSGVFATWKEAAAEAVKVSGSVIYLRADATWSASSTAFSGDFGHITVDLNGYTFTKLAGYLADTYFKNTTAQVTGITFKNGTIVNSVNSTSSQGIFCLNYGNNTALATFNLTFDNVTFINEKTTKLFFTLWEDKYSTATAMGSKSTITFNDCTIDTNGVTVFSLCVTASRAEKTDVDVVINGGTIKFTKALTTSGLYTKNSDDTVKFGKGKDGEYTKIILPESVDYPEGVAFEGVGGETLYYVETGTTGTYLLGADEQTEYGSIPARYPAGDYPLAVFAPSSSSATGYAYSAVFAEWKDAAAEAVKVSGSVIYLRTDAAWSSSVATTTFSGNFGHITVDLNGHTYTKLAGYLVDVPFKNTTPQTTSITFKNGTLVNSVNSTSSQGMFCLNYNNNTALATFNMTFDNVEFINEKSTKIFFTLWENGYSNSTSVGSKSTITFNDCTIDTNGVTVFSLCVTASRAEKTDVDVVINGGTIKFTKALTTSGLYTKNSDDTVKFGKGKNGEYTKIVIPSSVAYPEGVTFEGVSGETLYYAETGVAGTYALGVKEETEYGSIPARYPSAVYPFAVFAPSSTTETGYTCSVAYASWSDAMKKAASASGSVIYLRRDANQSVSGSFSTGKVTIDLNGFTLRRVSGYTIDSYHTNTAAKTVEIIFKNGTIVNSSDYTGTRGMFCINYSKDNTALATVNFTFDNVEFINEKTADLFFAIWEDGYANSTTVGTKTTATFNNCTIDSNGATVFLLHSPTEDNSGRNKSDIDIIVNGGTIISDSEITAEALYSKNPDDGVKFGKYEDRYTIFVIPVDVIAPDKSFILESSNGTELVLSKSGAEDENVIYTLMPAAAVNLDFKPKMSITLGSELVYNIYVPVADYLKSFTVDGNTVECKEIFTLDDGNSYYRIEVSLPAKEAARNIILKATVTVDGKDYTGSWTTSIPKYAAALLETSASEEEKTLVKDVLQYIRAAYAYFGTEDAEQMAKIDTLLGEYASKPTVEGSDAADTTGMKSATLVLSGKPSIRFYLADGANASAYKFYIGVKQIKTVVSEDGTYIDTDVYAYELCETVTYTINGEAAGSFHINAYYAFVSGTGENSYAGEDKEALTSLTECFWKYLQSARAYRASVIEG